MNGCSIHTEQGGRYHAHWLNGKCMLASHPNSPPPVSPILRSHLTTRVLVSPHFRPLFTGILTCVGRGEGRHRGAHRGGTNRLLRASHLPAAAHQHGWAGMGGVCATEGPGVGVTRGGAGAARVQGGLFDRGSHLWRALPRPLCPPRPVPTLPAAAQPQRWYWTRPRLPVSRASKRLGRWGPSTGRLPAPGLRGQKAGWRRNFN
jgi:hypothetical protein